MGKTGVLSTMLLPPFIRLISLALTASEQRQQKGARCVRCSR
jgi:hypothetical protein